MNLDVKSVWMDEVITALFSLGRSYLDVPLEAAFSLSALDQLFTLKPTTCAAIAQTVSTQSVHPPLFFCWLHDWLSWLQPTSQTWVWKLRSLPALAGVGVIFAIYYLNRIAFSRSAGLAGAIVMAVSPFAVYLSQEARHYTVPMLLLSLALVGMIRIQQDFRQQQLQPGVWLGWIAVNGVGFYVHYFFILATIAQLLTLVALLLKSQFSDFKAPISFYRHTWLTLLFSTGGIGLVYWPWMPTFLSHLSRPETDWLTPSQS
ncbi:MAG: glycosyltransferase family 39 protein, partial [Phormidesmis sp. CAN_BIN36]|nr:glycosyltransferase family 39 protein [Phormidesmis sp. CAN_BIN36]